MFLSRPDSKHHGALRDVPTRSRPTRHLCDISANADPRTDTDTYTNGGTRFNASARANTTADRDPLDQLFEQLSVLGTQALYPVNGCPAEFSLVKTTGPAEVGTSQVGIGEICAEDAA